MPGSTRSYEMARRLVAMGHDVHMVTSWCKGDGRTSCFETVETGIKVHWLPVSYSNHMGYFERTRAFFKFAVLSARKAASLEADIVFASSTPLTIALPAIYTAKRKKVPMVFEVRDLWPELPIAMGALRNPLARFFANRLELYAYKNATSIVALSPGMKDGVIRTGYSSLKVAVIPNSSDIEMFRVDQSLGVDFRSQRKFLGDKPILIYTGAFGVINGIHYMVELAVELAKLKSNIHILLIGDGSKFNEVTAQAKIKGVLNNNLFIEKSLPKKNIPAALSCSTMASVLFIDKPEMRANSANKFFDALAAGKPVLVNYGGWMHELVMKHDCGLAMWNKLVPQVANELNNKMNDQDWLLEASISSRRLAEEFFGRDELASQLEQVLLAAYEGRPELSASIAPGFYI